MWAKKIENFTFTELVKDSFDNIFSLDSRLFQTLKFLIIRPGFLTNEYWSGKRITYLPPFRLYLLTSILFFFIPHPDYQYGAEEFYPLLQKGMFVLMPCVALILLILYRKNNLLYFHHFITSLHFHSFMLLLSAIAKSVYFFNEEISISLSVNEFINPLFFLSFAN